MQKHKRKHTINQSRKIAVADTHAPPISFDTFSTAADFVDVSRVLHMAIRNDLKKQKVN
jgi:hypothetical protein